MLHKVQNFQSSKVGCSLEYDVRTTKAKVLDTTSVCIFFYQNCYFLLKLGKTNEDRFIYTWYNVQRFMFKGLCISRYPCLTLSLRNSSQVIDPF